MGTHHGCLKDICNKCVYLIYVLRQPCLPISPFVTSVKRFGHANDELFQTTLDVEISRGLKSE